MTLNQTDMGEVDRMTWCLGEPRHDPRMWSLTWSLRVEFVCNCCVCLFSVCETEVGPSGDTLI